MRHQTLLTVYILQSFVLAQQIGKTSEIHPKLTTYTCTRKNGCDSQKTSLVLDYFWRNVEDIHTGASCLTQDFKLNKTICPNVEQCAKNCALEGANYTQSGVEVSPGHDSVTLQMYHHIQGDLVEVAPQVYLLDEDEKDYVLLKLLNQEISFEVDISNSPCGIDAAMYLTGMDSSGGRSKLNPAGAAYGTGYCDSQCWDGWPFINGVANVKDLGVCCNEMDLWEANAHATQTTVHPCNITGLYACSGSECSWHEGVCDRSGCGFNPYSLGARDFYGYRDAVDTSKPFRVVTQFPTDDGTSDGSLIEVRRLYVQDSKIIHNARVHFEHETFDSISAGFCNATAPHFEKRWGVPLIGKALKRGMVMVLGIWSDPGDYNDWLDSGEAGPCNKTQGKPILIKENKPGASITFSNIRYGDINSTYNE